MKIFRFLFYGTLLTIFPVVLTAQENKGPISLSLKQAQEYALQNNKSILNANLDVEAAKKKVWETTAIGLPQISGKGSYSYTPELSGSIEQFNQFGTLFSWMYNVDNYLHSLDPSNGNFGQIPAPGPPEPYNPNDYKWSLSGSVTATQLIFSGSYLVGLQSAKVYKSLSQLNLVKSKQDILQSIIDSYFNVLIARENKSILDSTYQNLSRTFSELQAMNKQGFIEETDVDQMKITVTTVKNSLDMITRMEQVASKLLNLQLGIDLDSSIVLTDSLKPMVDALTIDKLLLTDFVLDNNVSYQMLDAQVKASELLLKLQKSAYLPDLAGFYQYYKEFNDKAFSFSPPHTLGVSLNIPIFSSGQRMSKVSQAKIDLEKAQNNKEQLSNSLKLEYYTSKSALINARDKYQSEISNLQLSKKIYDRALIKYTNGLISSVDLNQIQNQYLTAQSNYYQSLQSLISEKNKLEKILTKN